MNNRKKVLIIGLGTFGATLLAQLTKAGISVLGIDKDEKVTKELADKYDVRLVDNAADIEVLKELDINTFNEVVIAIGEHGGKDPYKIIIHLRQLKPDIHIRARGAEGDTDVLETLDVNKVIIPEEEAAIRVAQTICGSFEDVVERHQLGQDAAIEILVDKDSYLLGKTVRELLGLTEQFSIKITTIRKSINDQEKDEIKTPKEINPEQNLNYKLSLKDIIVALGDKDKIEEFENYSEKKQQEEKEKK